MTNNDIILTTGGVTFILKMPEQPGQNTITVNPVGTVPTPVNPTQVTPAPLPPVNVPGVGKDGVLELFATDTNWPLQALYLDVTKDPNSKTGPFCNTYGSDVIPFKPIKGVNNANCIETNGHVVKYASGAKDGLSNRFHWYYVTDIFGDNTKYKCWSDKPTPRFLNNEKTMIDCEMTAIIETGEEIGKDVHKSTAFKMCSIPDKPNDTRRSTFEICMANSDHPHSYVNYNYAHANYVPASGIKEYTDEGVIKSNTLIGLKAVRMVAADLKSCWFGQYINTNPLNKDGTFNNDGWKLKAEFTAVGIKDYQNIVPIWGGVTDYLRIDGYKSVRLYNFSIRPIIAPIKFPHLMDTQPGTQFKIAPPPATNQAQFNTVVATA